MVRKNFVEIISNFNFSLIALPNNLHIEPEGQPVQSLQYQFYQLLTMSV
jgi:hypothetical protein